MSEKEEGDSGVMSDDGNVFVLTKEEREMVEFLRKLGLSECLGGSNHVEESLYNYPGGKYFFKKEGCVFIKKDLKFPFNIFLLNSRGQEERER